MDTFKEKMMLDDMVNSGKAKWQIWTKPVSRPVQPTIAPALKAGAPARDILQ
jgi:glucose-1-phosphate cytidylyltransferase